MKDAGMEEDWKAGEGTGTPLDQGSRHADGTSAAPDLEFEGNGSITEPSAGDIDHSGLAELEDLVKELEDNPHMADALFRRLMEHPQYDLTDPEDLVAACRANLPQGYVMRGGRLHVVKRKNGAEELVQICSPLMVTCTTADENGENPCREVLFVSPQGRVQKVLVNDIDLTLGSGFIKPLVAKGFYCAHGQQAAVARLIQTFETSAHKIAPTKPGWCAGPVPAFKLTNGEIIGAYPALVATHYASRTFLASYRPAAEKWRDSMAPFMAENHILIVAALLPLASTLLELLGENSFGLHLQGPSSIGKSTAAIVANSAFSTGDLRSVAATANGLEPLFASHNDCLLVLDEMLPRKGLAGDLYKFANGSAKARADSQGGAVAAASWKTILLTTGEITPSEACKEEVQTGTLVRLITTPAGGHKFRMFDSIGAFETAGAFVSAIKSAAKEHAGSFGPAFIEELCRDLPAATRKAKDYLDHAHKRLIARAAGRWSSSQHHRILRSFAQNEAAGLLALDFGLAPWTREDSIAAVEHCAFRALRHFDNPDFFKLMKAHETVAALYMHLEAAEQAFITPDNQADAPADAIGWKDAACAFIKREEFEAWFGGAVEAKAAQKQLAQLGLIIPGDGRHMLRKLPRWTGETGRAVCVDLKLVPF
jgi:putative DNA primase/helicase